MSGSFNLSLGLSWRSSRRQHRSKHNGGSFTPVEGGGGDENAVTFMGEVVTYDGEPITFVPTE